MTMLTDLAVAARKSGLRVVEVEGWKTRGRAAMAGGAPKGILVHHTATSAKAAGNYPTLNVIIRGHGKLPGPLSQLGLGRDGTVYVIAAGRCNHAGATDLTLSANSYAIGIEAEHSGVGPWPTEQYLAYVALVAALAKHYAIPVSAVRGHKEAAVPYGRKNDPNFSMPTFRDDVTKALDSGNVPSTLPTPPRDPNYGHRGTPRPVKDDGLYGPRTHDAFMWLVDGDRLVGMTRDNVRDIQTWVGRPRTGLFNRDDILTLQRRVSAVQDGAWRRDVSYVSNTTVGLQRTMNKAIKAANQKESQ